MKKTYLDKAKMMPPLRHKVGEHYDVMKSEVCDYLCSIPEVRERIFDLAKEKKFIVFDPETRTWSGNRYESN